MARIIDIIKTNAILVESPVWSVNDNLLYWVDIKAPAIHCYDPISKIDKSWPVKQEIGSIALRKSGGFVSALRDGFAFIEPGSDHIEWIHNPEADKPLNRFNDGKCDRQGRFWAGSMYDPIGPPETYFDREPIGTLYRLDSDYTCHTMKTDIYVSNGIAWSTEGKTMYFTDSPRRTIWAMDYDTINGSIGESRTFATIENDSTQGTFDGATVDIEDHYWCAEFGGGRLIRFAPDGSVNQIVDLPISRPTCCAFGGKEMKTLFVTSAKIMMSREQMIKDPHAGDLIALDVGVKGVPETKFPA